MKIITALFAAVLLAGCARTPENTACPAVEGVGQVLAAPGVFIGDMHGSTQSPAFLAALACHAIQSGRPVIVAMEYDATDQPVLDRFLQTADVEQGMAALTGTAHWTGNVDGRASVAMADALRRMHSDRRTPGSLKLVAYDFSGADVQQRDATSARHLQALHDQAPQDAFWILFGGNVHARKTIGLPFRNAPPGSEQHQPLGYKLRDWGLIHLNAMYRGGEFWGCTGASTDGCGVVAVGPACTTDCRTDPVIRLHASDPAYDGVYDVSYLSVSRPLHWSSAPADPD